MKTVDREAMIQEARRLFDGTEKKDNPEYLRGMCELIAYCFGIPDVDSADNAQQVEEAILSRGNLDQDPQDWLNELFSGEYCAECGGDAQHHTAVPFNGNWFAGCDYPPDDEGNQHPVIEAFRKEEFQKHY